MSQFKPFLVIGAFVMLLSCNSKESRRKLTFQVQLDSSQDFASMSLRGVDPLLKKGEGIEMDRKRNTFSADLIIPDSLVGKRFTYRFYGNGTEEENKTFPPRELLFPSESTILSKATFDDKSGSTGELIKKSTPIPVIFADSPEEKKVLGQAFKGITTDGEVIDDLFRISPTGVSTEGIKSAADAYLSSLNTEQRKQSVFAVDDDEWRKWHNIEIYERAGVKLEDMNESQKKLAFAILEKSLSNRGVKKAKDIMKMEDYLAFLILKNGYGDEEVAGAFGSEKYYFTFMGTPSLVEPWGWQIDGHHLVVNCFILGDQLVMTPYFMGSEPTLIEEGENKGIQTFRPESDKGHKLYASLDDDRKRKATLLREKQYNFIQAEAFKDNFEIAYRGIRVSELNKKQTLLFEDLLEEYIGNIRPGHAAVKMAEVRKHYDETYFSWVGGISATGAFYYRIQSPVVLIEFDNQGPTFLWDRETSLYPGVGKKHTHTLVRTPNGNDYGKELLKQHLEEHHHNQ